MITPFLFVIGRLQNSKNIENTGFERHKEGEFSPLGARQFFTFYHTCCAQPRFQLPVFVVAFSFCLSLLTRFRAAKSIAFFKFFCFLAIISIFYRSLLLIYYFCTDVQNILCQIHNAEWHASDCTGQPAIHNTFQCAGKFRSE